MAQTYAQLLVHVVFSTQDRRPHLTSDLTGRLFPYMAGILRNLEVRLLALNGTADHVHLLLSLPASAALADVVRTLKANSSRWVREEFANKTFAWQPGYGAFSVSPSHRSPVCRYIERQEEHHRHLDFREELLDFLKRSGIEYDERWVGD